MVVKCIVLVHITAELREYWLACFTCICSYVELISSGPYICNGAGIFGEGHYAINMKCMYISACANIVDSIE